MIETAYIQVLAAAALAARMGRAGRASTGFTVSHGARELGA